MPTGSISAVARITACSTVGVLAVLLQVSRVSFAADDGIDYLTQIKPVLRERCFACHGPLKQEGGLRLDTAALAIKGGDSGAAIKPGDAEASTLLQRVLASDEGERMPPDGEPLSVGLWAVLGGASSLLLCAAGFVVVKLVLARRRGRSPAPVAPHPRAADEEKQDGRTPSSSMQNPSTASSTVAVPPSRNVTSY